MIESMLNGGFLEICAAIGFVLLGFSLVLSFVRILIGPTLADRVVAIDLLTILAMGFIGLRIVVTRETLYLEIAIALGLMGFIATVFFARLVEARMDPYTRQQDSGKAPRDRATGEKGG